MPNIKALEQMPPEKVYKLVQSILNGFEDVENTPVKDSDDATERDCNGFDCIKSLLNMNGLL